MTTTNNTPTQPHQLELFTRSAPRLSIQKRRKPTPEQGGALQPQPTTTTPAASEQPPAPPESHSERVIRLLPRLHSAARSLNNTSSLSMDNDDLAQEMALFLLEHPEIRLDGACVKFSKRRALTCCSVDNTYRRYVDLLPVVVDEDGEESDFQDFIPDPAASPEDQVIEKERLNQLETRLQARLSQQQYSILQALRKGYRQVEIAETLGLAKNTVSIHVQALRRSAQALLQLVDG